MKQLRERIEAGEFSTESLYPTEANLLKNSEYMQLQSKIEELTYQLKQAKGSAKSIKQNMKNDYHQAKFELMAEFRKACEKEFSTAKFTQKVRDKIWHTAWENGHSSGYSEVLSEYQDAADFAHDFLHSEQKI